MSAPSLSRIIAFRLPSADPDRLVRFYAEGIGFHAAATTPISPEEMAVLGLAAKGCRRSLALGDQRIDLDGFSETGRPYPADADAADLSFQHCAIVVTDAVTAYRRALDFGAQEVSNGGPVQLPKSAGGVIAAKFRDPEGHPLEFLQFPPDARSPWVGAVEGGSGALGIDHSAISVADADASTAFYEQHGLKLGHRTLNEGETQAALDGLPAPVVDVVPLLPSQGTPHLELLGYRTPQGRPARPSNCNDIAATRIVWASDRNGLLLDPDGHLHQLGRQP